MIVRAIEDCARCGGTHDGVEFQALGRPIEVGATPTLVRAVNPIPTLTHWAPCPTTGEPILMAVFPDVGDDDTEPAS